MRIIVQSSSPCAVSSHAGYDSSTPSIALAEGTCSVMLTPDRLRENVDRSVAFLNGGRSPWRRLMRTNSMIERVSQGGQTVRVICCVEQPPGSNVGSSEFL